MNEIINLSNEQSEQLNKFEIEEELLIRKLEDTKTALREKEQPFEDNKDNLLQSEIIMIQIKFDILNEWIAPNKDRRIEYKLLYRSSRDTMNLIEFHLRCDGENIRNTFVLIQLYDEQIIGGLTMNNWNSSEMTLSKNTFVFNLNKKMKYNIEKSDEAIIYNRYILLHFGFGDIEI